ncbi:MAG: TetR/AcrR family transcriptional regulator [Lactobacillus sp.]|nr:TetR/AcrR family transcriptional regulator [Lactobacillus sp.]MCI2033734.1 TetR/AcrR family transcriptional regulator [Lactobacillus sp.]
MVGVKNNRRVQYTREQLRNALIVLLQEQPLAQITVTAICQAADVNRGTFYAHYDNPAALFASIEGDLAAQIQPLIGDETNVMAWLPEVLRVIQDADAATAIILQNIKTSSVLEAILRPLRTQTKQRYRQRFGVSDPALLDYYFEFFCSGAIQVITNWLARGAQESPETIATIIANVTELG